jgi:RNA polymerase sigma factor (sigma-70 family)
LASECSSTVVKQIAVLFRTGTATGLTDGSLLDRFRSGSAEEAEAAFAVLVERHAPMVLNICRRITGDRHDAEDASQAVFLVLARQARSIRRMESVASWLYGVATRVAARARKGAARRRLRERRIAILRTATQAADSSDLDAAAVWPELYQALGRLPEHFLRPILLCHLEGLTYQQAAERLGCPVRTVQSRLSRGRKRLRDRLARRGLAPSIAFLTEALAPDATRAAVSPSWTQATITAATHGAAGGTAAALIPRAVSLLALGASNTMNLHRQLKRIAAVLLFGIAATGAGMSMLARSAPPQAEQRAKAAADDNRYRTSFKNGATVEVIGISTVPSGPHTWWKPDGSPLDLAPVDTIERNTRANGDRESRVILLRPSGLKRDDLFRWLPTRFNSSWGGRPSKNGRTAPDLEYYEATFPRDLAACDVLAKVAAGAWKTEVSNDGKGGTGRFVNGHKFSFGKARPLSVHGRELTVFAVAHNFFGQDRRLVAIDRDGEAHPAHSYSAGSDGDKKWVIDIIDAEFDLPPDQIKEFQVQFRPIEESLIKDIALNPRSTGKPAAKAAPPPQEIRPSTALISADPNADSDGDGLSDFQEVHKYRTDPKERSTAGDGVSDGDWQRRREFAYSIRSVVKVMPPVNVECLNDDYQDALVRGRGENFIELEVIHYPLNSNAAAIGSNPDWRRAADSNKEFLCPGITTNWDETMRSELISALKSDGIDPGQQGDKELVARASAWLIANSKYVSMFCTHYMHYPNGHAAIYPGLEARFDMEKGDRAWTVQEQLDRELFGRSMFANRTHGSCTSSAVFLTTALRALGIPTRMVLCIPALDGNDQQQLDMVRKNIKHHQVRRTLLKGLSSAKGYANHTFNEVFLGGRWVRLNYKTLGQNILDGNLMGLLTHVNTFNDLSEVPLAATWGKRYANGERDEIFRYGNPYRCEEVSDHFGKFAKIGNPEVREHRALTISRAYWADDPDAHATIKESKWLFHNDGSKSILVHGEEWFEDEAGPQYRPFLEAAGKEFVFKAVNHPDVHGRITTSSITWHSRNLHEIEVLVTREEYARMEVDVEYSLTPPDDVAGYKWNTKGRVTIMKKH